MNIFKNTNYIIGSTLSILLTIIPFYLIKNFNLNLPLLKKIIVICGIIHILVHMKYFFHLSYLDEHQWYWISFIFVMIIIFIIIIGSIWIMSHLNYHLM